MTNGAARRAIHYIESDLAHGFAFVPLIGAGLSAPSGAPLVWELQEYLHLCICLALGAGAPGLRPWNPRKDHWPPFAEREKPADYWWTQIRNEFEYRRKSDQWDPQVAVFQEALGAMAEWRTSLLFLARIVHHGPVAGRTDTHQVALDAPRQEIVDSCLRHAMTGKLPTLGHRMLAMLAPVLRFNVVLTTNFDDLLERAFEQAKNPLTVFDVHLQSTLPPWSAIAQQRSLIKMHGHLYSLRADYTLDALPSSEDRWRLLEYLAAPAGRHTLQSARHSGGQISESSVPCDKHLLVLGMSAREHRTRAFIEHAWRFLGSEFKVYWICHTEEDVKAVRQFTSDYASSLPTDRSALWEGSRVLRYPHLGLFFLHLYQTLRRGLPMTGIIFPSTPRLAIPPLPNEIVAAADQRANKAVFLDRLLEDLVRVQSPDYTKHRLLAVTSRPDAAGVTSACALLFSKAEAKGDTCIWLDLNDVTSTDDLFEQLYDALCYRLGIEKWLPFYVGKSARQRASELRRLINTTRSNWVIFLNARETPGSNISDVGDWSLQNGWLDRETPDRPYDDDSQSLSSFNEFLAEMTIRRAASYPASPTLTVVLLCRRRLDNTDSPCLQAMINDYRLIQTPTVLEAPCADFSETTILTATIAWAHKKHREERKIFLHALLLAQRTRYLQIVWSKAAQVPEVRSTMRQSANVVPQLSEQDNSRLEWLDDLESLGLIRRKPGGFIWMQSRIRGQFRRYFKT